MKSIYALLVGINEYRNPVKPLLGCVDDVKNLEHFIKKQYADTKQLQIKTLLNEDATYSNINDSFKSHLAQANENDIVWFHFSGHGSEEKSAPEFLAYDSTGKDQTMLCYDSRPGEMPNLADKELAVLLHSVANEFPDGSAKSTPPHIIISLDCCHSGSGTRSKQTSQYIGVRNTRPFGIERQLDSYANGYYATQNKDNLTIPSCPHIVLSACERDEQAGDLDGGGAFTTGLIKALENSNGKINYPDLYLRTRATVRKIRKNQNPKFSFISNINPYTEFLNGASMGTPDEYEVYFKKGRWYIKCGAIHGLPTSLKENINIEIHTPSPDSKKIGDGTIVSVGSQECELKMDLEFSLKSTLQSLFSEDINYRGIFHSFPVKNETVYLTGDMQQVDEFICDWDCDKNIVLSKNQLDSRHLELQIDNEFSLVDLNKQETILVTNDNADIKTSIEKIIHWYRFLELRNTDKASIIQHGIDFHIDVLDAKNVHHSYKNQANSEIKLLANDANSRDGAFGIMPKVSIQKINQDLFFYLFYLKPDYAIECPEEEIIFDGDSDGDGVTDRDEMVGPDGKIETDDETNTNDPKDFHASQITLAPRDEGLPEDIKTLELNLWKEYKGLGPAPNESSINCHFKLLVTSEELDYFQFIQTGIGKTRSDSNKRKPSTKLSDEWAVFNLNVKIEKE